MEKTQKNLTNTCAVASCSSPNGISYHKFPKEPSLRKIWLEACKMKDKVNPDTATICARHFKQENFVRDLRNELLNLPVRNILKAGNNCSQFSNDYVLCWTDIIVFH